MADRRRKMNLAVRAEMFAYRNAPGGLPWAEREKLVDYMRLAFVRGYNAAKRDAKPKS
jgi:hypothetical protein